MLKKIIQKSIYIIYIVSSILVLLEYFTHTNFVLQTFKIDYFHLFVISSFMFGINILLSYKNLIKKHWKQITFFLPIILIISAIVIFMRKHQTFLYLETEDSIIEWLQFIFICISSFLSALLSRRYYNKNKLIGITFGIISFVFLVFAGEEISWGQRIFNFKTPTEFAAINNQNELTLHNYEHIYGYVYKGYMLIGLIGSIGWIIKSLVIRFINNTKINEFFTTIIPDWQYSIYFLVVFVYNLQVKILHPIPGDSLWEEPMELLLYICFSLFLFEQYKRTKMKVNK